MHSNTSPYESYPDDFEYQEASHDDSFYDDDISSIVAAFDPIDEPELLTEYLRVWAASSRHHTANLFDHVTRIETESVACLEVQRLIERRIENRIQVPSNHALPTQTYQDSIQHITFPSQADLVSETIQAIREGSAKLLSCSCKDGIVTCSACSGKGTVPVSEGQPPNCVVCGGTKVVAHEVCNGAGTLTEYIHGTIIREVETSYTMSGTSHGLAKAKGIDWWESDTDPARILPLLPQETSQSLIKTWNTDPPNTVARYGSISAVPIYKVIFRHNNRERHAWLLGTQLRVVLPGSIGKAPIWLITRALTVTVIVACLLIGLAYWQNEKQLQIDQATQKQLKAPPPAPKTPSRVAIPKN